MNEKGLNAIFSLDTEFESIKAQLVFQKTNELSRRKTQNTIVTLMIGVGSVICAILAFAAIYTLFDNIGVFDNQKVYITSTGKCYHKSNCKTIRNGSTEVNVLEARRRGYSACGVCGGGASHLFILLIYVPILMLFVFVDLKIYYLFVTKPENLINEKYKKMLENEINQFKNRIENIIAIHGIHALCSIPVNIRFEDSLPISDTESYEVFVKPNRPTVFHINRNCCGTFLVARHAFTCPSLRPCGRCAHKEIVIPQWYIEFQRLYSLCRKYGISL